MKLLITTQIVDRTDPFLGFFHRWIVELAKHFESIEVICLYEGKHELPANVRVHSLGKDRGARSKIAYTVRFLTLAWKLRGSYDSVFVHMNQEYVLLAGWLWSVLRKPIYLWRNHYAGGFLTDVAAMFAEKIFCTSRFSYTAKYPKTVIMPVGVDADSFTHTSVKRAERSILFFSRFAPAKKPHVLLDALIALQKEGIQFTATFYGTPLPRDAAYREKLVARVRELGLTDTIRFHLGVPHSEAPAVFSSHEIFVNLASSGTYDKTMFEAAASRCLVLAASKDFAAIVGERYHVDENAAAVTQKLREFLALSGNERATLVSAEREIVLAGHGLQTLGERLREEIHRK